MCLAVYITSVLHVPLIYHAQLNKINHVDDNFQSREVTRLITIQKKLVRLYTLFPSFYLYCDWVKTSDNYPRLLFELNQSKTIL